MTGSSTGIVSALEVFHGVDEHTTPDSDRLVRLPMYYNIDQNDLKKVIEKNQEFIEKM